MITNFTNQEIDHTCVELYNYAQNIWPVKTTGDGNCLFHAISNSVYGNESQSYNLKLCSVFIVYENQDFFQNVLKSDGDSTTIPELIDKILKLGKWQNRTTIVALNILIGRPIYSYGNSISTSC